MGNYLKLSDTSGLSLIATVLALLLFSLFIAVAVSLVTTGASIGLQEEQGVQAFYIAEGGIERALYSVVREGYRTCDISTTCPCDGIDGNSASLGTGSFTIDTQSAYVSPLTTLSGNITADQTSIPVASTAGYAPYGRIIIDREVIEYTYIDTDTNTFKDCRRGVAGTIASSHLLGARVLQKQCLITSTGNISTNPLASVQRRVSTVVELQEDGWIVGAVDATPNEVILGWNSSAWGRWGPSGTIPNVNLNSVNMLSYADGWAVGDVDATEVILRWDGTSWNHWGPSATIPDVNLNSVYMLSSGDGWAVGDNGTIIRWNGANWASVASPTTVNLNSVYMLSSVDGWAVGVEYRGTCTGPNRLHTILYWNGSTWSQLSPPLIPACSTDNKTLNSVLMLDTNNDGKADDGWAVGDRTGNNPGGWTFLRWNGVRWNLFPVNTSGTNAQNLNSVFMLSPTEGFAVGNAGVILRWNGSTWSLVASPTNKNLNSAFMVSSTDGWAVGNGGRILRWNGTQWSIDTTLTGPSNLNELYVLSTSHPVSQRREVFP